MADCKEQYAYDICVYVWGQFTAVLFPIQDMFKLVSDMVENPTAYAASAGWTLAKKALKEGCEVEVPAQAAEAPAALCVLRGVALLFEIGVQIAQNMKSVTEMEWTPVYDYCKQLHEPQQGQSEAAEEGEQ